MQIRAVSVLLASLVLLSSRAEAQFRVANPASGENFGVELGLMFWKPTPELSIQSGELAPLGDTQVDFVQEFGIEDKRFMEFRGVIKAGQKHKLRVSYVPFHYTEEATLQRTISFGGQTFPVSALATADLKWDLWRFGYEYDVVSKDRGLIGIIAEVKYNKVTADLTAVGFGTSLTEEQAPIPTLGFIGRGYVHPAVAVTVEFTGLKLPGFIADRISDEETIDADFSDFDLYVTGNLSRHFGVQGGYRAVSAEYLIGDDAGDLKMKGFYFGAVVRF